MSPRLIESHYENNYGAALNHLNAVTDELESLDPGATPHHLIGRLKQDQIAALNSTLLHELYFASLGGDGRALPEVVAGAIARDFGSVDRWRHEFAALANNLAHGSGWVLLTYVPRDGRLINQGASDHGQNIAGGIPILALDMYEHAYHIEFGANASAYIATFMRNIDWAAVQARYEDAVKVAPPRRLEQKQFADVPSISVEEVQEMRRSGAPVQIIDTRPKHYSAGAGHDGGSGLARSRAGRRLDRRAFQDRARRHVLCIWLPYRMRNSGNAARGWFRCPIHVRGTLWLESGQGTVKRFE
jgi:superoxide dismutase, Fe-Mn family